MEARNTTTPLRAIRLKCLDCCCGSSNEVKLCTAEKCPLYPFRFGKNPNRAGIGNPNAKLPNSASDFSENSLSEGTYLPEYDSEEIHGRTEEQP